MHMHTHGKNPGDTSAAVSLETQQTLACFVPETLTWRLLPRVVDITVVKLQAGEGVLLKYAAGNRDVTRTPAKSDDADDQLLASTRNTSKRAPASTRR